MAKFLLHLSSMLCRRVIDVEVNLYEFCILSLVGGELVILYQDFMWNLPRRNHDLSEPSRVPRGLWTRLQATRHMLRAKRISLVIFTDIILF